MSSDNGTMQSDRSLDRYIIQFFPPAAVFLLVLASGAGCQTHQQEQTPDHNSDRVRSEAFELRYVSDDRKANGITDFKGKTAVFDTGQRIEYLEKWASYGTDFFQDEQLNQKVFKNEQAEEALNQLKPQPDPEVRTSIPVDNWKYLGYRENQREQERASIREWESKSGAQVQDGRLRIQNATLTKSIEDQTWRVHFRWDARAPDDGEKASFTLSGAVDVGFDESGSIYYVTDGTRKQGPEVQPGEWYDFKVELDLATKNGRYNLLVDGETVADFVPLAGLQDGRGNAFYPDAPFEDGESYLTFLESGEFADVDVSALDPDQGTVEMWFNLHELGPSGKKTYLFGHVHPRTEWANRIYLLHEPEQGLGVRLGDSEKVSGIVQLETNRWYHVALSWNDGDYTVYVDGKQVKQGKYNGLNEIGERATLGNIGRSDDRSYTPSAHVYELRVWNQARGKQQVQKRMKNRLAGDESGLIGYWPLNSGEGDTLVEASGSGEHTTKNGAVWRGQMDRIPSMVDSFSVDTSTEVLIDNLRFTSFGSEYEPEYTYPIITILQQDFELSPDPAGFEHASYDDSDWKRVPYRRYAHGGERNAGEALYLRKSVQVADFERAVLDIETVRPSAVLYVNGEKITKLYRYPEKVDLTDELVPGEENLIAMKINPHDASLPIHHRGAGTAGLPGYEERKGYDPIPPRGYAPDYNKRITGATDYDEKSSWEGTMYGPRHHMSTDGHSSIFAGLTSLGLTESVYIDDVFAHTTSVENPANLRVQVTMDSKQADVFDGEVVVNATHWYPEEAGEPAAEATTTVQVNGKSETTLDVAVPDSKLWTSDDPDLYKVHIVLRDSSGNPVDDRVTTTGLRTVGQSGGTFRINGEPDVMYGPLIFGHRNPIEYIAQWMFSPPKKKLVQEILATKRMNGNAFRMSVHDKRFSGVQDKRLAQIADQLGLMLMWQTPTWMRSGDATQHFDFKGLAKYAKAVRNHPSIVMWQPSNHPYNYSWDWYTRILDTLVEVDPSRLVSPSASIGHLTEPWPREDTENKPKWHHKQLARGHMERTMGYGSEWSDIRTLAGGGKRLAHLNSDTHAWFDFESEETIAQANWSSLKGKPYYRLHSYEHDYDQGSIGRHFRLDEWEESQAWQALSAYESFRKKRWLDYDGLNWVPFRGGGNTVTYKKPLVDYQNHAKLGYYALQMAFQPTLAGSKNVDLVYGPNDHIPITAISLGEAKEVDLQILVKTMNGVAVAIKTFRDVQLPAGRTVTDVGEWNPDLQPGQYYGFEYRIK